MTKRILRAPGHVVVVAFAVEPAKFDPFLAAMVENASTSLEREPGCLMFEVAQDRARASVFLYEVYASEADFALHLGSDHFKAFCGLTDPWVRKKEVSTFATALSALQEGEHA